MPAITTYVSAAEIKASKAGFDFSGYEDEVLTTYGELAKGIIDNYCGRWFGNASKTESGETIVDREGRIVVRVKEKPIASVTTLKVWLPGSLKIDLNVSYLDLFKEQGYMYYSISSAYGVFGQNFPTVVLWQAEKLSYEIVYASSDVIPSIIKHASIQIVVNLLKSDYYFQQTGVAGIEAGVKSFRADDYSVDFGSDQVKNDSVISPSVKEILNGFKRTGQSMI